MSIRIGDSATFSLAMVTPQSRAVETRLYLITPTEWYKISKKCIAEKKFLILTICIGYGDRLEYMPNETQWRNIVEDGTRKLISLGGNKNNCRVDIINEPEKYCTKEKQAWLINIAHNQIGGRLIMGAGCSELSQQERYQYISSHATFEVLIIHMQGACDTEAKTSNYTNFAKNLALTYRRDIDCNEANYKDVATSKGFKHLKMMLRYAEKIECKNFPIVFNNLDQWAFPNNTDRWKFLCFKVNGVLRSPYFAEWVDLMNSKSPIPNIVPLPIPIEEEDMKLKLLQLNSRGNQVRWLQEILEEEYEFPNEGGYDGIYGAKTLYQVKAYQTANGLVPDGKIGKLTTFDLINKSHNHYSPDYWKTKLQIFMWYE